tara:strand:+ start:1305 stop:1559 length:255 start_codon:yes stop_codon:yes gene_type:complete
MGHPPPALSKISATEVLKMNNKDLSTVPTKKVWVKPTLTCFGGIIGKTFGHDDDDDDFTRGGGSPLASNSTFPKFRYRPKHSIS